MVAAILAVFIAKLLSPIPIVVGVLGALLSRAWWHVILTAITAAALSEMLIIATNKTRVPSLATFLIGVLAAGVWAALAFGIKRIRQKR